MGLWDFIRGATPEQIYQEQMDTVCGIIGRNDRNGVSFEELYRMNPKGMDRLRLEDVCSRLIADRRVELHSGRYFPPDRRDIPRENQQQQRTPDPEGFGPGGFNIRQYHIYPQQPGNPQPDPYQQQFYNTNAWPHNSALQPHEWEQEAGDDDDEPEDGGGFRPTY